MGPSAGELQQRAVQCGGPALPHGPPVPAPAQTQHQEHGYFTSGLWCGPSKEHPLPAITGSTWEGGGAKINQGGGARLDCGISF